MHRTEGWHWMGVAWEVCPWRAVAIKQKKMNNVNMKRSWNTHITFYSSTAFRFSCQFVAWQRRIGFTNATQKEDCIGNRRWDEGHRYFVTVLWRKPLILEIKTMKRSQRSEHLRNCGQTRYSSEVRVWQIFGVEFQVMPIQLSSTKNNSTSNTALFQIIQVTCLCQKLGIQVTGATRHQLELFSQIWFQVAIFSPSTSTSLDTGPIWAHEKPLLQRGSWIKVGIYEGIFFQGFFKCDFELEAF